MVNPKKLIEQVIGGSVGDIEELMKHILKNLEEQTKQQNEIIKQLKGIKENQISDLYDRKILSNNNKH